MNIAIITYFFPESTIVLAKYLASLGHTVHYYYITDKNTCKTSGYHFEKAPKKLGVVDLSRKDFPELYNFIDTDNRVRLSLIRKVNHSKKPKWNYLNSFILWYTIRKIVRKNNYDCFNLVGHGTMWIPLHKFFKNKKVVQTLHEVDYHFSKENPRLPLVDYLYKNNIPIIVHSKTSVDKLEKLYGKNNNVHLVPFSLFEVYKLFEKDNPFLGDFEKDDKTDYILNYGFISAYKGVEVLIEAFNKIKDTIPNVKLIIAGGGNIKNIDEIDHNRTILINRYLSNAEIIKLNKLAKFVICPYLSASQSGIPMVTYLFKKPLIASKVGAFEEVIEDKKNGILVNPGSVDQLSEAIFNLADNKDLYENLLNGVDDFIHSDKMNWSLIAKKTEEIYSA